MFKKLREIIYNKKTRNKLENIMFDNFSYVSDFGCPCFVRNGYGNRDNEFFYPKTEEMFIVAFSKLKNRFYLKTAYVNVKDMIKEYCNQNNFSEYTINYCLDMFKNKRKVLVDNKTNVLADKR